MYHQSRFFQTKESRAQHTNRILIIEHSESLGTLYKSILLKNDYTILMTSCGQEALAMLASFRPNLIISPNELSDMNSDQLRQEVSAQSDESYIPVLVLSTQKKNLSYSASSAINFNETLFLPFRIKDLRNSVQQLLEDEQANSQNFYYQSNPRSLYQGKSTSTQQHQ